MTYPINELLLLLTRYSNAIGVYGTIVVCRPSFFVCLFVCILSQMYCG